MHTRLSILSDKIIEAGWLVAIIVTPLFFDVFTNTVFDPDKITLLRSITLIMLLAWLVGRLEHRYGGARDEGRGANHNSQFAIRHSPFALPALLLALVYILTTLTSMLPRTSLWGTYLRLEGTYTILCYIAIFFLMAHNLRSREQVERLLTAMLLTSLPVALFGMMQHYRLDPIRWADDMTVRVGSTLGWPVFAGAYLIMVVPLTLHRLVQSLAALQAPSLSPPSSGEMREVALPLISLSSYGFLLILQVLAILFTQSRGPFLGLLGGSLFFFLILTAVHRRPSLSFLVVAIGVELLLILAILNLPNTPLASLRDSPALARLSRVFDAKSGTGRWRLRVWSSALDLITDHPARTVVGTGPESLYILFNQVFPQDAQAGVTADRSHNETLDTLVRSGLLGLGVYLFLFGSIFYHGLQGLGLVQGPRQGQALLGLLAAGGLVGALLPWLLQNALTFVWVGLPAGLLVGLVVYVLVHAFFLPAPPSPPRQTGGREGGTQLLVAALLSALVAHFIELQFSFGVAATYLYFWVYAALLAVAVQASQTGLPAGREAEGEGRPPVAPNPSTGLRTSVGGPGGRNSQFARKRRRGRQPSPTMMSRLTTLLGTDTLVPSMLTGIILMTMGFSFVNKQYPLSASSFGVPLLFFATWLFAALVIGTESESHKSQIAGLSWKDRGSQVASRKSQVASRRSQVAGRRDHLRSETWDLGPETWDLFLTYTIVSLGWFVLFIIFHLLGLSSQRDLATPILLYYLWLFLSISAVAALLLHRDEPQSASLPWQGRNSQSAIRNSQFATRNPQLALYLALAAVVAVVIWKTNVDVVRADTYYNWGIAYEETGQWETAVDLYRRAIAIAPAQDRYHTFLGGAYGARAVGEGDPDSPLFHETEAALRRARDLSPLDPDHWANLGRLYQSWALLTGEPEARLARLNAALESYQRATVLSPNNHGRRLKDNVLETYLVLGDHYLAKGEIKQAAQAYDQALERDSKAVLDRKLKTVKDSPQSAMAHGGLALVYGQMGQAADALDHLRRAMELAAADEQATLESLAAFLKEP